MPSFSSQPTAPFVYTLKGILRILCINYLFPVDSFSPIFIVFVLLLDGPDRHEVSSPQATESRRRRKRKLDQRLFAQSGRAFSLLHYCVLLPVPRGIWFYVVLCCFFDTSFHACDQANFILRQQIVGVANLRNPS